MCTPVETPSKRCPDDRAEIQPNEKKASTPVVHHDDIYSYENDSARHLLEYAVTGALLHFAGYCYSTGQYGDFGRFLYYLALLVLYPRNVICCHEAFHYLSGNRTNFFMRYLVFSPELYFHYDLYRKEHFTHHQYMATSKDKNIFMLTGTPIQGFLKSFINPEWRLFDIAQEKDPDVLNHLRIHWAIKLLVCGVEMYLFGAKFWFCSFYLPYRVVQGLVFFVFFYVCHHETKLSAYWCATPALEIQNLELPPFLEFVLRVAWGDEVVEGVTNHASHHTVHQWSVRVDKLSEYPSKGPFTPADRTQ